MSEWITPERRQRMINVCRMIMEDAEADAKTSEGAPFTGAELGRRLGEVYATQRALADLIATILRDGP